MAEEENNSNEDRSEEATPERREEFRERGQVAVSREVTSVFVLAAVVAFLYSYSTSFIYSLIDMFRTHFERITDFRVNQYNILEHGATVGFDIILLMLPLFLVAAGVASLVTFLQTRFNFSMKKLKPDFKRMNPLTGLARMVSGQSLMELGKGIGKIFAVSTVAYLVLLSEWVKVPGLMHVGLEGNWSYWLEITRNLFFGVCMLLLVVGGADFLYNFITLENKLRMTKKEVKDDFKKREVDPHVKGRMRRMQRDLISRQVVEKTKSATAIITNPTHYSIAIKYELGMKAPIVLAKGKDFLALQMREAAKENDIPLVENRPLARALYKTVEMGQEIPETLYKAVSEVIRYVFKMKGVKVPS